MLQLGEEAKRIFSCISDEPLKLQSRYFQGAHLGSNCSCGKELLCYLCLGRRLQGGGGGLVPPGQRGAEPLHLAQVDQEGAVGAVHAIEGVARVRGPTGAHPLQVRPQKQSLVEPCWVTMSTSANRCSPIENTAPVSRRPAV